MRYVLGFLILFIAPMSWASRFSPSAPAQQSKEATRWSLAQWMEQKGKLQWMDIWLNSNTKSPSFYEIYLGGDYAQYESNTSLNGGTPTVTEDLTSWRAHAGMFVSLLGVHGQYEKSEKDHREQVDAVGQLRILGHTDQGSNLTGFYGIHRQNFQDASLQNDQVQNTQAGGYLTLYLVNFWAIQGKYQHFFENKSNLDTEVKGHRIEASTWVEWGAIRVYGTYFKEPMTYSTTTSETQIHREGFNLGLRVYLDFKK